LAAEVSTVSITGHFSADGARGAVTGLTFVVGQEG